MIQQLLVKALPSFSPVPSQEDFDRWFLENRLKIRDLIGRLRRGEITVQIFGDEFYQLLTNGHGEGWALGRMRSGDLTPFGINDWLIGRGVADRETEFLRNFLNDLTTGRYLDDDGLLIESQIITRADLYVGKFRATAAEGFVETGEDNEEYNWIVGAVEEHCSRCPEMASMNPWTKQTLFTYPGAGDTPCLGNCKCHLVRLSDGRTSFKPS